MSEQFVKPLEAPPEPGETAIPGRLADYLKAQGYRWSWQHDDGQSLSDLRYKGIHPLRPEMLKKENPEVWNVCFGEGEDGQRMLWIEPDSGYVKKGDTILAIQKQELWEQHENTFRKRLEALEAGPADGSADPEKIAEALQVLGLATEAHAKTRSRSLDAIAAELAEEGP